MLLGFTVALNMTDFGRFEDIGNRQLFHVPSGRKCSTWSSTALLSIPEYSRCLHRRYIRTNIEYAISSVAGLRSLRCGCLSFALHYTLQAHPLEWNMGHDASECFGQHNYSPCRITTMPAHRQILECAITGNMHQHGYSERLGILSWRYESSLVFPSP